MPQHERDALKVLADSYQAFAEILTGIASSGKKSGRYRSVIYYSVCEEATLLRRCSMKFGDIAKRGKSKTATCRVSRVSPVSKNSLMPSIRIHQMRFEFLQ